MNKRKRCEDEPFINKELLSCVNNLVNNGLYLNEIFEDTEKEHQEERHLSELYRISQNFDEREFAVVVISALKKSPHIVRRIFAEYIISLKNKGDKNHDIY